MCIKINFKRFFKRIFPCLRERPEPIADIPEPPPELILPEPEPFCFFGCSVYELIQQNVKGVEDFLGDLRLAGGNATEIFLVHSLNGNIFQPYVFDSYVNKYDLTAWNTFFWVDFKYFLRKCKELGIVPFIRIHDQCSVKNPEWNKFYCFMNNVQGFTDVYDDRLYPFYSRLNKRILKELRDVGIKKYFIIPMNECDGKNTEVYRFNIWYVNDLLSSNVSEDQIIISADSKHLVRLKDLGCRYEAHDIASRNELVAAREIYDVPLFPNGDGCHGKGICSWNGYCEPSPAQFKLLSEYIKTNDLFGYCYKARRAYLTKGEVHLELVKFRALKALTGK